VVRYADDTIVGFEHEHEAQAFLHDLQERTGLFDLALHPQKTQLIRFGRASRFRVFLEASRHWAPTTWFVPSPPTRRCRRADCSLQRDGSRRQPATTNARSGRDQHGGGGPGAQLDVVWNFFEAHHYRYALRESDPLEGRTY